MILAPDLLCYRQESLGKAAQGLNMFCKNPRILAVLLLISLLPSLSALAEVVDAHRANTVRQNRIIRATPVQTRLRRLIREEGLPSFRAHGRVHFGLSAKANAGNYLSQLSPNLVELSMPRESSHLYTRIGDMTYDRMDKLNENRWRGGSSERIGALVHLKDGEMRRLKDYLDRALDDSRSVLGPYWGWGGGRLPGSNCTSYLLDAPIGKFGKRFGDILGIWPWYNPVSHVKRRLQWRLPNELLTALIESDSPRVKAIVVHNPQGKFDRNYDFDLSLSLKETATGMAMGLLMVD